MYRLIHFLSSTRSWGLVPGLLFLGMPLTSLAWEVISSDTLQVGGVVDHDLLEITGGNPQLEMRESAVRNTTGLVIGKQNRDAGHLLIQSGSRLSNQGADAEAYLGLDTGSAGTATVTGAGSRWENSGPLYAGSSGSGTLRIENGGVVSNARGYIGHGVHSTGVVTVSGENSIWQNSGFLDVGYIGTGRLNIENGGLVSNTNGYMGTEVGSQGTVTVSGENSHWQNAWSLKVGEAGTGILHIHNGGQVSNGDGLVGVFEDSSGTVEVTGANSLWNNTGGLSVGGHEDGAGGTGLVSIGEGGVVNAAGETHHVWAGGKIDIQAGGTFHLQGGTLTNSGQIQIASDGTLINDGTINGSLTINGGTFTGAGTYSSLTVANGTVAAPGNSPGVMTSQATTWGEEGVYQWEIASLAGGAGIGWDLWHAVDLSIEGRFTVQVTSIDSSFAEGTFAGGALAGWDSTQDQLWLIATATNAAFDTTSLSHLELDWTQFDFWNDLNSGTFHLLAGDDGNHLYLNFTASNNPVAVPEPASVVLLLCSGGTGLLYHRCQQKAKKAS